MKGQQDEFIKELKTKHNKELEEELLDIFTQLEKEQRDILAQSDEKKKKQR